MLSQNSCLPARKSSLGTWRSKTALSPVTMRWGSSRPWEQGENQTHKPGPQESRFWPLSRADWKKSIELSQWGPRKLVNVQRSPLPRSSSIWANTKSAKYVWRSEGMELLSKLPEGKVQRNGSRLLVAPSDRKKSNGLKHRKFLLNIWKLWGCLISGTGYPETLWSLHHWKYSGIVWPWSWASRWPYLSRRVDVQRCHSTATSL